MRDRISLDREIGIFQKLEIDDVAGILKIDEDADFLAGFGFKCGSQHSSKAEWRKNTGGNLLGDTHNNDILDWYVIRGNADAAFRCRFENPSSIEVNIRLRLCQDYLESSRSSRLQQKRSLRTGSLPRWRKA